MTAFGFLGSPGEKRIIDGMKDELFHVFRNTPHGREAFLQSLYFARRARLEIQAYIPAERQFVMYFDRGPVTVTLDPEFLTSPQTAEKHLKEAVTESGVTVRLHEPRRFTAGDLPDVPIDFGYMCCPRSLSDLSARIRIGPLGPKVRTIVNAATFPVLIPSPVYREWDGITAYFDGSDASRNAVLAGLRLRDETGLPLRLFTFLEKKPRSFYEDALGADDRLSGADADWIVSEAPEFGEAAYEIPPESLVVYGAFGGGLMRELLFGSRAGQIQAHLPNNLLLVGRRYG